MISNMQQEATHRKVKNTVKCKITILANNPVDDNVTSDHTPTPTRFIRNCEELGLFQDLQNVNPFEEGFQKALTEKTIAKQVDAPRPNSNGSLNTPVLLPHIVSVISLKNTLKDNQPSDSIKQETIEETTTIKQATSALDMKKPRCHDKLQRDRRRESNRLAQQRARNRKKLAQQKCHEKYEQIAEENQKLRDANLRLSLRVQELEQQLLAFKGLVQPSAVS